MTIVTLGIDLGKKLNGIVGLDTNGRVVLRRRVRRATLIERLWRSLKYECVSLRAREAGSEAKAGVGRWINFHNHQRPHAAHDGQPPAVVCFNQIETGQQRERVA